jgi:hypothetical protein
VVVRERDPQFRIALARRERRAEIVGGGLAEEDLVQGLVEGKVDRGVQARALRTIQILSDGFIIVAPDLAEDQELLVAAFRGERLGPILIRFSRNRREALGRIVHGVDETTDLFDPNRQIRAFPRGEGFSRFTSPTPMACVKVAAGRKPSIFGVKL